MNDLKVSLIQSNIHWQNIDANLADLEEKIWKIEEQTRLIVLPEMFNTGFTMLASKYAELMNGKTFRWMKQMAGQTGAAIVGSYIVSEKNFFYNRLVWMMPGGSFLTYDKRHLFRITQERKFFKKGRELLIADLDGWKICPLICYDLRFPVWSRNKYLLEQKRLTYDIAIFIANWPAVRINVWNTLLKARAMENSCYTIGVNRTGIDGNKIEYPGRSAIINPLGKELLTFSDKPSVKTIRLSYDFLLNYRQKFPSFLDGDQFEIKINQDG